MAQGKSLWERFVEHVEGVGEKVFKEGVPGCIDPARHVQELVELRRQDDGQPLLLRELRPTTSLWRVVRFRRGETVDLSAGRMGAPPSTHARAGRANREGESVFYAADYEPTAVLEVIRRYHRCAVLRWLAVTLGQRRGLAVATWVPKSSASTPDQGQSCPIRGELLVLDMTAIVGEQSQPWLAFFRDFAAALGKSVPARRFGGRALLGYLPTQYVVAAVWQWRGSGTPHQVDGLLFPSSTARRHGYDTKNLVVFDAGHVEMVGDSARLVRSCDPVWDELNRACDPNDKGGECERIDLGKEL